MLAWTAERSDGGIGLKKTSFYLSLIRASGMKACKCDSWTRIGSNGVVFATVPADGYEKQGGWIAIVRPAVGCWLDSNVIKNVIKRVNWLTG